MKERFIRIIGNAIDNASEESKKDVKDVKEIFVRSLFDQFESLSEDQKKHLEKVEYPKSEEEKVLINFANKETNQLMKKFGIDPYDIPMDNYHIVPTDFFNKIYGAGNGAIAYILQQGIIFNAKINRDSLLQFGTNAFHETLHLKAHLTFQVSENKKEHNPIATVFREGFTCYSSQAKEKHKHFVGLHEAIVALQEEKSFQKMLKLPIFNQEKNRLESEKTREEIRKVAKDKDISENEIFWISEDGKDWKLKSYPKHRMLLKYICQEIQKEFSEEYDYPDNVFEDFLKAHFTGQILFLAKKIEKTFGKGSFRILGNMTGDEKSARLYLETFKKMRLNFIKRKLLVNATK